MFIIANAGDIIDIFYAPDIVNTLITLINLVVVSSFLYTAVRVKESVKFGQIVFNIRITDIFLLAVMFTYGLFIGGFMHIIMDAFNPSGVYFRGKKISFVKKKKRGKS